MGTGLIRFAELVGVALSYFAGGNANLAEIESVRVDMDCAGQLIEIDLTNSLDPDMQGVASGRDVANRGGMIRVGDCIERRGKRHDDRAHLGMNVAEDIRNSLVRKSDRLACSRLVEAEIEALAIEERKYVMEKRIGVGELDCASDGDDLEVRNERAVFLQEPVVVAWNEGSRGSSRHWFCPDDDGREVLLILSARAKNEPDIDASFRHRGVLRAQRRARDQEREEAR